MNTAYRHAVGALLLLAIPTATFAQTTARDMSRRNPDVAWPRNLEPSTADLFNHNELLIEADCAKLYQLIASPAAWPSWLPIARDVRLAEPDRPLQAGSRFSWVIFGIPIDTAVYVAEPGRRFGYTVTPPGPPPSYAQSWLFTPVEKSCRVTTEEVGVGDLAKQAKEAGGSGSRLVHVAHELWLAALRWRAVFGDQGRPGS